MAVLGAGTNIINKSLDEKRLEILNYVGVINKDYFSNKEHTENLNIRPHVNSNSLLSYYSNLLFIKE